MGTSSDHPEFELEKHQLNEVIRYIESKLNNVDSTRPTYGRRPELHTRYSELTERKKILASAIGDPYFGRFDFQQAGFLHGSV